MITIHSIKTHRPARMDTKKYHHAVEQKKRETTKQLRQEVRGLHANK